MAGLVRPSTPPPNFGGIARRASSPLVGEDKGGGSRRPLLTIFCVRGLWSFGQAIVSTICATPHPVPPPQATGCTHRASRRAHTFPSLLGKVARRAGWGVARGFEAGQACATIRASVRRRIPACHTPSVGLRPTPSPLRGEGGAQPPNIRAKTTSALAALVVLRRCVHAVAPQGGRKPLRSGHDAESRGSYRSILR